MTVPEQKWIIENGTSMPESPTYLYRKTGTVRASTLYAWTTDKQFALQFPFQSNAALLAAKLGEGHRVVAF